MQHQCSRILKLLLLLVILLFTTGWECDDSGGGSSDDTDVEADDKCPYYDSDCDGLSNATETNDANSAVFLDPDTWDANPSTAHGRHCDSCGQDSCGYISGALNLVDAGTGYYHYNGPDATDTDDWGVAHLLLMIEMASRDYHRNGYPPPGVGVGDLSKGSPGSYYGGAVVCSIIIAIRMAVT